MKVYLALPAMNEYENLPNLLKCISNQNYRNFELFICVNQPEEWWADNKKKEVCCSNQLSLKLLKDYNEFPVHVFDKSSNGKGWKGKHFGVGWARKTVMDAINAVAYENDLIVSIDADTYYPPEYLNSVVNIFKSDEKFTGLSNPYYHRLTEKEALNRAILRYEIYMRNYSLNMLKINCPYQFTALGSAIVLPVWAYRKIGGITPHKSGEDFYLLQKLAKSGKLCLYNRIKVFPSPRISDRVFFGTGPAVEKGLNGEWSSYPIYRHELFSEVKTTFQLFAALYKENKQTPMDEFLLKTFKEVNIWNSLRNNSSTQDGFIKLCTQKIDGLRILQYLKIRQKEFSSNDESHLFKNLKYLFSKDFTDLYKCEDINFEKMPLEKMDALRNFMIEMEDELLTKV